MGESGMELSEGERKGQLKWYPPDFDPRKHKSLDAYHGTHPLRERAKKIDKGILVIRFEMPYDIWCGGCGIHIAQSVRYNAEKQKVGMYYTTPVWQFRMRCHLCPQYFEIKTDPANHDYVILSGARRKEKRWDPKENEQIVTDDKKDIKKMKLDAMYGLEHGTEDKAKLKSSLPGLQDIERAQSKWKDDYELNTQARNMFRGEKKLLRTEAEKDASLLKKSSLDIALVEEHEDDVKMASLLQYTTTKTFDERQEEKRQEIESRPLFATRPPHLSSPSSSSTSSGSGDTPSAKVEQIKKIALTKKKLGLKPMQQKANPFGVTTQSDKSSAFGALRKGIVRRKVATQSRDSSNETATQASGSVHETALPHTDNLPKMATHVDCLHDRVPYDNPCYDVEFCDKDQRGTENADSANHIRNHSCINEPEICTEDVSNVHYQQKDGKSNNATLKETENQGSVSQNTTSSIQVLTEQKGHVINEHKCVTQSAGLGSLMASYESSSTDGED